MVLYLVHQDTLLQNATGIMTKLDILFRPSKVREHVTSRVSGGEFKTK